MSIGCPTSSGLLRWTISGLALATMSIVAINLGADVSDAAQVVGVTREAICQSPFVPEWEPTLISLDCGDVNNQLTHIHWTSWSPAGAFGNGENYYLDCNLVSCAESRMWITVPAQVKLVNAVPAQVGRMYRRLEWRDLISESCTPKCTTRWAAWRSESLDISSIKHFRFSSCSRSNLGLAADSTTYGTILWCRPHNGRWLWQ
jgi:hypothetical protein